MTRDLKHLSLEELEAYLEGLGEPLWRAGDIRRWMYMRGATDLEEMTTLPKTLRERMARDFTFYTPVVANRLKAEDGTEKLALRLVDGALVETVLIPLDGKLTLCISSQSGCTLKCAFCQTGRLGKGRNLAAAEILDQWLAAERLLPPGQRISRLVFMGMGEPLLNYEALKEALTVLTSPSGGGMSPSRITVSTAGIIPGIEQLGRDLPGIRLAVSLNAPENDLRSRLMPVNRKYPLPELMEALRRYPRSRDRITIEYVLLGGTNDSPEMAAALSKLLRGLHCKVNLIPFNAHSGLPFLPPGKEDVERFREILQGNALPATVRWSRGGEISAACGQLGGGEMNGTSAAGPD